MYGRSTPLDLRSLTRRWLTRSGSARRRTAVKAEPPVASLSRPVSYYLRTRLPNVAPLTRNDATGENLRFATTELHQPSPFACVGDFDGDGLEDVALVARDQTTQGLRLLALHQVSVNWNVGGLMSKSYNA